MVLRPRLIALAAALVVLVPAANARADSIAPGLSRADAQAIFALAGAHWPAMPCRGVQFARLAPRAMRGLAVATDARGGCAVVFNRGARLTPVGWCQAMYGVYKRLARGTQASAWPYDCTLTVGPRPTRARLVAVPGISAQNVRRAYEVADAHWHDTGCRGHEQLHWSTPAQLAAGTSERPEGGAMIMGQAQLRDPRCVVYLNATVAWDPKTLCVTLEHEFGHLKGLLHSADPEDVMYPVNARAADCEQTFAA
jgi:Matrixin